MTEHEYPVSTGRDIAEAFRGKLMRSDWPASMKVGMLDMANGINPDVEYVDLSGAPGADYLVSFAPVEAPVPVCTVWVVEDPYTGEPMTVATFVQCRPLPASGVNRAVLN